MQPDNGWFQSESRQPVNGLKPEGNEMYTFTPVPRPNQQKHETESNNNSGGLTYRQMPYYENAPYQTQNNIPKGGYADITFTRMPDNRRENRMSVNPKTPAMPAENAAYSGVSDKGSRESAPLPVNVPGSSERSKAEALLWDEDRVLTTRNSQTVGMRGPVLTQDSILHEALEGFVYTNILERPVHIKGFGAFGYFQTTNSMREYTKLSFLQSSGQQVPAMVRFSLAGGNRGTADTVRTVRGFAVKFYTRDGIFDLVGNHIPVLFVRDGMRFPAAFTSFFPSPVNNLTYPERFWRFFASAPEATHFVTWLFSNAGTIKSFRHMQGFGVNTYVWRNAQGVRRYVKYQWIPLAGTEYIDSKESATLAGMNPDYAGKDLYDAIASGNPVQYELCVQLMDPKDEDSLPYDPLDCTKVWDERMYPLISVGRLTLNRNPDDYMNQVEKAAFSPSNLLDGMEFSDDKLLQARINIYSDSQRRRLGENFRSIPVNNQKYWSPERQVTSGEGDYTQGEMVRREIRNPDNFTQAGEHYNSLSAYEKEQLVDNLASDLASISEGTRSIALGYLYEASAELGQRVSAQLAEYTK